MNIWPPILSLIDSKTAITDEIGDRLFPKVIPQGETTFPQGTYRKVSVITNRNFDGGGKLIRASVDFAIAANSQKKADEIVQTFKDELEDETGTFAGYEIRTVAYVDSGEGSWLDVTKKQTSNIELQFIMVKN